MQGGILLLSEIRFADCKIQRNCRDGNKRTVETVEHSAVTRKNVARILYAELAFHQRFHKVAPCSEHNHHQSHSCPLQSRIKACVVVSKNHADANGKNRSANRAFPRLVRRDALEQRMLSDKRANAVCTCVACPQKDEDGKEIEMKSICHLDSMDFYNKQYYKLIDILRTIG